MPISPVAIWMPVGMSRITLIYTISLGMVVALTITGTMAIELFQQRLLVITLTGTLTWLGLPAIVTAAVIAVVIVEQDVASIQMLES